MNAFPFVYELATWSSRAFTAASSALCAIPSAHPTANTHMQTAPIVQRFIPFLWPVRALQMTSGPVKLYDADIADNSHFRRASWAALLLVQPKRRSLKISPEVLVHFQPVIHPPRAAGHVRRSRACVAFNGAQPVFRRRIQP